MVQNGVIETATGNLLRAGFCDFENDGSFDSENETMRTDCPFPAKCRWAFGESQMHRWTGSAWTLVAQPAAPLVYDSALVMTFMNSGAILNTGAQCPACMTIPCDCEILCCQMFGAPEGSIVVDLWVDTYANYPPTDADSIVASAPPTISGGVKSEDKTLTGWTKELSAGDVLLPNIDSVSAITWAKLMLLVKHT